MKAYTNNATAPRIIERASALATAVPCVKTVKPSDAKATEGAAPNNPAKVFGFSRSEMSENAETTKPPIKKRMNSSFN